MSILISDPDQNWSEQLRKYFAQKNCLVEVSGNGKECQLKAYRKKYECLILDIDTANNSGAEVLKFIRLNHPDVRVILTVSGQERLTELKLAKEDYPKLGIAKLLVKPYTFETIVEAIDEQNYHASWKKIIENDDLENETEVSMQDSELTRIDLDSISLDNAAIFDCYTRISKNKFLKVFSKGDVFNKQRLEKHFSEKDSRFIYFKTKDRAVYINFMNDFIVHLAPKKEVDTDRKVTFAKSITEKYIEEVYTKGLHSQLMEEGKRVCGNMYEIIQGSKDISVLMKDYQHHQNDNLTQVFLTSFFSVMIAKNLNWKSARTVETLGLGGLLHDIGKMKIDRKIREKAESLLTDAEMVQYRKYPAYGAELLQKCEGISEAVVQIVYQHRELMPGTGFPNKLSGAKIYPLAKVVCLAAAFSQDMVTKQLTPMNTLKELISNRNRVFNYDPALVKALISCFIKPEEKQ
jgi:response regulator RpfG family c-di-GMP phosphodiesterase